MLDLAFTILENKDLVLNLSGILMARAAIQKCSAVHAALLTIVELSRGVCIPQLHSLMLHWGLDVGARIGDGSKRQLPPHIVLDVDLLLSLLLCRVRHRRQ